MKYEQVIYEKEGTIARITLNRPEKRNAWPFRGGMTADFHAAMGEAEEDDDVKVIIIKGAGPSFSAGHDLAEVGFVYGMGTGKPEERRASQRIRLKTDRLGFCENHRRIFLCPKITIAQVHGYCIGEGIIVMCYCDLAVAAENAQLGHTEQRLGFAGNSGSFPILVGTVGLKRALDLLLTGRIIDGKEAERIGLVNKAVPEDKLEEEVTKLAEAICLLPRDGIAIGKAMRHIAYEAMGLTSGFAQHYLGHTMFTNVRWEADEYNFFKQRRDKWLKAGYTGRDIRYKDLV